MATIDRLKKYGINKISGNNYNALMRDILIKNNQDIAQATAKLSDDHWNKSLKKISKPKRFILPDVSEVLPEENVHIVKAAEQGQLMSNTLRERLSQDLRDAMDEFRTKVTDEPAFLRRRGIKAGTINPKVIDLFQGKIAKTFENYTKVDPQFGVPSNIKTIAVTEVRTTINDIKDNYVKTLLDKNPDLGMKKTWKQNKELAKEPRRGHSEVNGLTINQNEKFMVPLYNKKGLKINTTPMDRPHDPSAPAEQTIGCNCELEYFVETT